MISQQAGGDAKLAANAHGTNTSVGYCTKFIQKK